MKQKFVILLMFLVTVTGLTFAAANKKHITLYDPATIAGTTLEAGDYVVEWTGTAPDVQVTFSRGKDKLVTVPAKLVAIHNGYDAVTLRPGDSGVGTIEEIQSTKSVLRFEESETSGQ
jgi:hypothetical protein